MSALAYEPMKDQVEALLNLMISAWRFRWTALMVIAGVSALGILAVLAIPGKYESQAEIFVDTKSVLNPLLQGLAVTSQSPDASDVVKEALLARPTLDRVARETGLYARTSSAVQADQLLIELARAIRIDGDASTGLYTISYDDTNPKTARNVVNALLETFVASSIGATRADTRDAEAFLARQVADYQERLSESEARLAQFKEQNIDLMPGAGADWFARLQSQLDARDKLSMDLSVAIQQREELRSKIASNAPAQGGGPMPTDAQIQAAETLDARIRQAKAALATLLENYTDRYPSVVTEKALIQRLETQRRTQFGDVRLTAAELTPSSEGAVDPVVQNLQVTLNSTDLQVTTLQAQLKEADAEVDRLQRTVKIGPQLEAELARLNRDYGVNKAEYDALLQRLEAARISNQANESAALRFKILEPPGIPLRPLKPNKRLLLVGVLLMALLLGAGIAVFRGQTHPVFHTKSALAAALKLPVLGHVSRVYTTEESGARKRSAIAYGSAVAAVFTVVILVAAFDFPASQLLRHLIGVKVQ